jgi:S1-C subfamily serine protease
VTNDHVIADRSMTYTVTTGGEELPATIMYADPTHDVAILKVDGTDHPHLTFGDSDRLAVGDTVVHIGNALGRYVDSASTGIVTALGKSIVAGGGTPVAHYFRYGRGWQLPARAVGVSSGGEHLSDLVELRANIYAGDSGGPVLDANGDVVAVTVAAASGVPTGYAIPANEVKAILAAHGVTI